MYGTTPPTKLNVEGREKFLLLPPPPATESGRIPETTQKVSGGVSRVAPPQKKSWLRRWM